MRLDRFICKSTELSRAQAAVIIHAGRVAVNGEPLCDERAQVHESNRITLDDQVLQPRPFRYIMLHKPAGMICSNVDEYYASVFRLLSVEHPDELHIVGRLDVDTTGLVLLTDDGRWSFAITNPKSDCSKVYRVTLRDPISTASQTEVLQQRLIQGIKLQGEALPTRPALLTVLSEYQVLLTLSEGKFHQVKRMVAALGNRVRQLHRVQIGRLKLDIAEGEWRHLSEEEALRSADTNRIEAVRTL
ncbi:MAG: pseudouridine synthase [Marinobacterium sp.]|nr:pseudouridine synthase [Marinobacterium sp.]